VNPLKVEVPGRIVLCMGLRLRNSPFKIYNIIIELLDDSLQVFQLSS
jgi:hypothetical protein